MLYVKINHQIGWISSDYFFQFHWELWVVVFWLIFKFRQMSRNTKLTTFGCQLYLSPNSLSSNVQGVVTFMNQTNTRKYWLDTMNSSILLHKFSAHTRKHKTNNTNKLEWHKFSLILLLDWRWFHKNEYLLSVTLPINCYFNPRCTNNDVIDAVWYISVACILYSNILDHLDRIMYNAHFD